MDVFLRERVPTRCNLLPKVQGASTGAVQKATNRLYPRANIPAERGAAMKFPVAFTVPGHPVPFLVGVRHQSRKRREAYEDYCGRVRMFARLAGIKDIEITAEAPLHFHTRAFFENRRHGDPENIHKAIVDAICYTEGGKRSAKDKHTGGAFTSPRYDKKNPRVEVVIADGTLTLKETIPEGW